MATTPTRAHSEDATPDLPDVLQFMQLLWAVVHGLETTSKRMAGDLGVTGPQRLALRVVGLFPGVSAGDLAAILHVHPSTLTGVLQRLVAQRWLLRVDDPRDRAVLRENRSSFGTDFMAFRWALPAASATCVTRPRPITIMSPAAVLALTW